MDYYDEYTIQDAIAMESRSISARVPFTITRVEPKAQSYHLSIHRDNAEQLARYRDATGMGWSIGAANRYASILDVDEEESKVIIYNAFQGPPQVGDVVFLNRLNFLVDLEALWERPDYSRRFQEIQDELHSGRARNLNNINVKQHLLESHQTHLREQQKDYLAKSIYSSSFLWGPPGTGKTFTLGQIITAYTYQNPHSKVLILSHTNTAVDQVAAAFSQCFQRGYGSQDCSASSRWAQSMKEGKCCRLGKGFDASHYEGREFWFSPRVRELIKEKSTLQSLKPQKYHEELYLRWVSAMNKIEDQFRVEEKIFLQGAQVVATTITKAFLEYDELMELDFDLVVLDEASQISIPYGLTALALGKQRVIAGDPKQLPPIYDSPHSPAKELFSDSLLRYYYSYPKHAKTQLIQQSRMAEPICQLISDVFYRGELRVAEDSQSDPSWHHQRQIAYELFGQSEGNLVLYPIQSEGRTPNNTYSGKYRPESAQKSVEIIQQILSQAQVPLSEIRVLTPFRAQVKLINYLLYQAQIEGVKVSTIHSSQGSESQVIIFDPVQGKSRFFQEEAAHAIVNVGLSRAKSQLIILASEGDRAFKVIDRVYEKISPQQDYPPNHIISLNQDPGFPHSLLKVQEIIWKDQSRVQVAKIDAKFIHLNILKSGRSYQVGESRKVATEVVSKW